MRGRGFGGRLLFIKVVYGLKVYVTYMEVGIPNLSKGYVYSFGKTLGNGVITLCYETTDIHNLYAGIQASSLNFGKLLMHHRALDIGFGGNAGIERDIRSVRDATSDQSGARLKGVMIVFAR